MRQITISSLDALANSNKVLLVSVAPVYDYVEGKRTDKQTHTAFTCVCPNNQYHRLTVKIPVLEPIITAEALEESGAIPVSFNSFKARISIYNNMLSIQCNAESIVLE